MIQGVSVTRWVGQEAGGGRKRPTQEAKKKCYSLSIKGLGVRLKILYFLLQKGGDNRSFIEISDYIKCQFFRR